MSNGLAAAFEQGGTFAPLRHRNYLLLWIGQSAHALALWMEQIARPFLVLAITDGSAAHVGGVLAVRTAPQLVFGVFAGVVSDWFDRRTILVVIKVCVLIISIAFAGILVAGAMELWHIYLFQFLRGSFMAFDQPARQSMIASVVPDDEMVGGVALMTATQNVMRIIGSAAGGFAIGILGMSGAFIAVAVIYVGAVVTTWMLDVPTHKKPAGSGARAMAGGLIDGARYSWNNTTVRAIVLMSLVYFIFGMSYTQVLVPLIAEDVMHVGATGAGIMVALTGVGALISALTIASRQPVRVGLVMPIIVAAFGANLVLFAAATYLPGNLGIWVPYFFITLTGLTQATYLSLSNATLLHTSPPEMRGRVISFLSLDRGLMSLGGMGAGLLADAAGAQVSQIVFGAVCAAGGVAILALYRELRSVRLEPGTPIGGGHGALPVPAPTGAATPPLEAAREPARL